MKPGGIFIVRVPNREDLSSYLNPDYPYDLAHVRGFDEYSLELLSDKTITNANTENNLSNSQEDEINVVDFGFQLPNLTHLFTNWL